MKKTSSGAFPLFGLYVVVVTAVLGSTVLSRASILESHQAYDRSSLLRMMSQNPPGNDMLLDNVLLPAVVEDSEWVGLDLLNLQRDRLAYRATRNGKTVAIAVPATADDGFNGTVDLLIAADMFGRIEFAVVLEDVLSNDPYGQLEVIQSQWMTNFTRQSMSDILRLSWSKIESRGEYDQFVGASVTPKSVSNKIYDALVFIQSNRIALMGGG